MKIQTEYPELSKYMMEMPANLSGNGNNAINVKNLEEYYNSLVEILTEYSNTHKAFNEVKTPEKLKFPGYPIYPPRRHL